MAGWIKLHRKLRDWRWYGVPAVKDVFLELLLTANHENGSARDLELKRGQAIFSYEGLSKQLGLSVKQVRTAISKLKNTGEISVWTNRHFSVATIVNYNAYQIDDFAEEGQTEGSQRADKGQSKGRQRAVKGQHHKNIRREEDKNKEKYKREKQSVFSVDGASFNVDKYEGECSVE